MRPAVMLLLASACASTTTIYTEPTAARLYIDDRPVGLTPYVYSDQRTLLHSTKLRFESPGLEPVEATITREEISFPRVLASIFLVPVLWATDYKSEYWFYLSKRPAVRE